MARLLSRLLVGTVPLVILGAVTAAFHWELLLPERIVGDYDVWTYFYPLRAYAATALEAGRLPLWSPEIFLGAPFLANPQTALFYPGTWVFFALPVPYAYTVSLVIHVFLAAAFTYAFARVVLGVGRAAALVAGAAFALGGAVAAQAGHINQLSGTPWLPLIVLCADLAYRRRSWAWAGGGSLAVGVQLLAGHAQVTYMTAAVVALLLWWRLAEELAQLPWGTLASTPGTEPDNAEVPGDEDRPTPAAPERSPLPLGAVGGALLRALGVGLAIGLPGAAIAGAQLLPTLELSAESIRSAGLTYQDATAFSLPPPLLGRALLPGYWANIYSEFWGYVGLAPLLLALLALAFGPLRTTVFCAAVSGLSLFLAFGEANALYPAIYSAIPGIDLFRVPARWLLAYSFGAAGLAALGFQWATTRPMPMAGLWRPPLVLAGFSLTAVMLVPFSEGLSGRIVVLWILGLTAAAILIIALLHRPSRAARAGLVAAVVVDLAVAGLDLPIRHPIPVEPYAVERPVPAYLQTSLAGRLLSIAPTEYEVPDHAELARRYPDLDPTATFTFKTVLKLDEVMSPNVPLRYGLSTVDGYDGGVLPLRRFLELASLLVPAEQLRPDGVLRTRLSAVPSPELLDLFGVDVVIANQVSDVEVEGIRFDTATARSLTSAGPRLDFPQPLSITGLALLGSTDRPISLPEPGSLTIARADGEVERIPLARDQHAFWRGAPGPARAPRPDGQDSMSRIPIATGPPIRSLEVNWDAPERWDLRGVTLLRADGGQEQMMLQPGLRRTLFPPLKVYTRDRPAGSVRLVPRGEVRDDAAVVEDLRRDPNSARQVVRLAPGSELPSESAIGEGEFRRLPGPPEHLVFTRSGGTGSGYLVVDDAWFPGWRAWVDSVEAPLYRANGLFKATWVPAGAHRVEFTFEPASLRLGAALSLLGLAAALALIVLGLRRRRA